MCNVESSMKFTKMSGKMILLTIIANWIVKSESDSIIWDDNSDVYHSARRYENYHSSSIYRELF